MSGASPTPKHTNRLAQETSPYLLQHAHNPVDWYPWGAEALERARAEDKPILLSIGYSACHWCHVMERESFEDETTAAIMNRHFVNVKVDREERPDLDGIYMQAVQAMTGQGGWPMTMFLAPDGTPFWGGTYFPPQDRHGMPAFRTVLEALAEAWRSRRDEVVRSGQQMRDHLQHELQARADGAAVDLPTLDLAARGMARLYDPRHGGFGSAPKFPQPMAVEVLLRHWYRARDDATLRIAVHTLTAMANGGIYDQLGGGFHRYSVDDHWLVPHFEKMLYDNAQLARVYLMGYQATGNASFRAIAEETLDYVLRDMTDPSGGFYSTEDADSEGVEGKFYVWNPAQVRAVLGAEDAGLFGAYYGITDAGNFEHGESILHVTGTPEQVAARLGVSEARLLMALERGRPALLEARSARVRPGRDEKVLASWNGMLLRAFAEAARVLNRDDYREAAVRNGAFLLREMRDEQGRMLRTWKPGHAARLNGYLEDHANVADGLIALYEATFDPRWMAAAADLAEAMRARFADDEHGGFYDTATDHETLITRPKDLFDNATPSGNAVAADVLSRLAVLLDRPAYREAAERAIHLVQDALPKAPLGFARMLSAADFLLSTPREIAIVGDPEAAETEALVGVAFEQFLPNRVVAGAAPDEVSEVGRLVKLLAARGQMHGQPTAYVCERYTCLAPVTTPDELRALLHHGAAAPGTSS